ncbi:MAG: hypothetical protein KKF44_01130, partial [Nanoarchaeota archaeon]|nr:hypothetical protein [Nanoarchaeota archaeon]
FQDICKIAAENSKDKDGNIRHACFLLVKNLNTLMIAMPFINMVNSMSNEETNLIYESFRDLFYDLAALYSANDGNAGKSILRSLSIMLPKIYDMAKFYNDEKEMDLVNEIKEEIMIGVVNWN